MESWHPVRWSKLAISCNFPLQQKNALAESGESCCPTSLQPQSLHWPTSPLLMLPGWLTTSAIQTGKLANKQYKTKRNTHTHTHTQTHTQSFMFQAHSGSQGVWLHSPCHDSLQDFVSWGMLVSSRDWICCFQNRIDLPSTLSRGSVLRGAENLGSAIFLHSCEICLLRFWSKS